jgi:hypothetical protein
MVSSARRSRASTCWASAAPPPLGSMAGEEEVDAATAPASRLLPQLAELSWLLLPFLPCNGAMCAAGGSGCCGCFDRMLVLRGKFAADEGEVASVRAVVLAVAASSPPAATAAAAAAAGCGRAAVVLVVLGRVVQGGTSLAAVACAAAASDLEGCLVLLPPLCELDCCALMEGACRGFPPATGLMLMVLCSGRGRYFASRSARGGSSLEGRALGLPARATNNDVVRGMVIGVSRVR